jgi:hypothetical protein
MYSEPEKNHIHPDYCHFVVTITSLPEIDIHQRCLTLRWLFLGKQAFVRHWANWIWPFGRNCWWRGGCRIQCLLPQSKQWDTWVLKLVSISQKLHWSKGFSHPMHRCSASHVWHWQWFTAGAGSLHKVWTCAGIKPRDQHSKPHVHIRNHLLIYEILPVSVIVHIGDAVVTKSLAWLFWQRKSEFSGLICDTP